MPGAGVLTALPVRRNSLLAHEVFDFFNLTVFQNCFGQAEKFLRRVEIFSGFFYFRETEAGERNREFCRIFGVVEHDMQQARFNSAVFAFSDQSQPVRAKVQQFRPIKRWLCFFDDNVFEAGEGFLPSDCEKWPAFRFPSDHFFRDRHFYFTVENAEKRHDHHKSENGYDHKMFARPAEHQPHAPGAGQNHGDAEKREINAYRAADFNDHRHLLHRQVRAGSHFSLFRFSFLRSSQ